MLLASKSPNPQGEPMSIWKDSSNAKPTPGQDVREPARPMSAPIPEYPAAAPSPAPIATRAEPDRVRKESLIAADLTIEGKIEGSGSVRIAGKFKGDVNVDGDLTIEAGAKLSGSVRANQVTIAGELEGNIEGAKRVDVQQSGVITGDVKAGSVTIAAGARMRGQAVFGWEDDTVGKSRNGSRAEHGAAA